MRKLVNIASVVLVVVLLLGATAAGYLWYATKQQVDQIVTMAKPFADISYGGIDVSPAGSVGVNRLRIMPDVADEPITIGSIRLEAPHFVALLHTRWQLSRNQLPNPNFASPKKSFIFKAIYGHILCLRKSRAH